MQRPETSQAALDFLASEGGKHLPGIKRGIEKESLRIAPDGHLAVTPHPRALGSALTNPAITTDYSEALPEFITPATSDRDAPLLYLQQIHQYVYKHIDDELLWACSMPCMLTEESKVPVAQYGSSNIGRMKSVYRVGLGHRYGRYMQTIAGVHYNFSFPESFWQSYQNHLGESGDLQDFISGQYFGLIRNFLRFGWIIPLLFGSSPALCKSFLQGRKTRLNERADGTLYGPHATSLRMSDLGYQNNAQAQLNINYNCVDDYIKALESAIRTEDAYYKELGVEVDGEYRQLNANLLQIENEYYSNIRPKRVIDSGERPTLALARRGVEYVEVRSLDLNPFSPIGVAQEQLDFIDAFLCFCLFQPSPSVSEREAAENQENMRRIVSEGRCPDLNLYLHNRKQSADVIIAELMAAIEPYANALDQAYQSNDFSTAFKAQRDISAELEQTNSGRFLAEMQSSGLGYYPFARQLSEQAKDAITSAPLDPGVEEAFIKISADSIAAQEALQAKPQKDFGEFLEDYFA